MNNKGFTLVELLVTIAIMGIVLGIAFPAISKLKTANEGKYYEAYEKVLLNGAKLYVDKYKKDLWKNDSDTTCYRIYNTALENEKLIEKFKEKSQDVFRDRSVYVYNNNGKTQYRPSVGVQTNNGRDVYLSDDTHIETCNKILN